MGRKKKTTVETIFTETTSFMMSLGIYKSEFDPAIRRYAELRLQYCEVMSNFQDDNCKITEEYTNKSGATNIRKTAIYQALENLRKELTDMENNLGLTPYGLKRIKDKGFAEKKKQSRFEIGLEELKRDMR